MERGDVTLEGTRSKGSDSEFPSRLGRRGRRFRQVLLLSTIDPKRGKRNPYSSNFERQGQKQIISEGTQKIVVVGNRVGRD